MDDEKKVEEQEQEPVESEEQVAEDSSPETNEQAVEQREDDYQGLARRMDDMRDMMGEILAIVERIESITGGFVEAGATVREGADLGDEISEDVAEDTGINDIVDETIDEVVDIDNLDLS